ncbi:hypothetical protein [Aeromicrobium sp. UC242_57]
MSRSTATSTSSVVEMQVCSTASASGNSLTRVVPRGARSIVVTT